MTKARGNKVPSKLTPYPPGDEIFWLQSLGSKTYSSCVELVWPNDEQLNSDYESVVAAFPQLDCEATTKQIFADVQLEQIKNRLSDEDEDDNDEDNYMLYPSSAGVLLRIHNMTPEVKNLLSYLHVLVRAKYTKETIEEHIEKRQPIVVEFSLEDYLTITGQKLTSGRTQRRRKLEQLLFYLNGLWIDVVSEGSYFPKVQVAKCGINRERGVYVVVFGFEYFQTGVEFRWQPPGVFHINSYRYPYAADIVRHLAQIVKMHSKNVHSTKKRLWRVSVENLIKNLTLHISEPLERQKEVLVVPFLTNIKVALQAFRTESEISKNKTIEWSLTDRVTGQVYSSFEEMADLKFRIIKRCILKFKITSPFSGTENDALPYENKKDYNTVQKQLTVDDENLSSEVLPAEFKSRYNY